jgi:hypothetical protein
MSNKLGLVTGRPCIHVYRYRESVYMRGSAIVRTREWHPMRRLSCKGGCSSARCWGPNDDASDGGVDSVDIRCKDPVSGALYVATCVVTGTDWETGYADEWHWLMVPMTAEQEETR